MATAQLCPVTVGLLAQGDWRLLAIPEKVDKTNMVIGLKAVHFHWLPDHMGSWERTLFKQEAGRSTPWLLVLGADFWLSLSSWLVELWLRTFVTGALGCSGSLASLLTWTGAFTEPSRCWAHQVCRPHTVRSPLLVGGSHAGTHAFLASSLWDTDPLQNDTQVLDCHMETESRAPRS